MIKQRVSRPVTTPDIVFSVDDLGVVVVTPVTSLATDTSAWINNNTLNNANSPGLGGPGVITGPINIAFSDVLPYFLNSTPFALDEPATGSFIWGSFDNNGGPVILYPRYEETTAYSVDQLWLIMGVAP